MPPAEGGGMEINMEQISIHEALQIFASYDSAIWYGVATAFIVFIIEAILYSKKIIFGKDDRRKERAIKEGHVIEATQIKCTYHDRGQNNSRHYTARYAYEIGGVKKEKSVTSPHKPPVHLLLYYDRSPERVYSDYDMGGETFRILLYIIPILAAYCVMKLMGYNG